eukprot:gene2971-4981_t
MAIKVWPFFTHDEEETSCCWPFFIFKHDETTEFSWHPFVFNLRCGEEFLLNIFFFLFFIRKTSSSFTITLFFGLFVFTSGDDYTWFHIFPLFFHYSGDDTSFQMLFLLFIRKKTSESTFLAALPFIWIYASKDTWSIGLILAIHIYWSEFNFTLNVLLLLFHFSIDDDKNFHCILFLFLALYKSKYTIIVIIPILLSAFHVNPDEKSIFFTLFLLYWSYVSIDDGKFEMTIFAFIFYLSFADKKIDGFYLFPLFLYSNGDNAFCGSCNDDLVFICFIIPTYISSENNNITIYSIIFCRSISGKDKFYSLFIGLFIYTESSSTKKLWLLAPCFFVIFSDDYFYIMFLPTLTFYYKNYEKPTDALYATEFLSIAYFLIGFGKIDNFQTNWVFPLYHYYSIDDKDEKTRGLFYGTILGHIHSKQTKDESLFRSYLIPLYFVTKTSYTGDNESSIFVWIFPIFIYKQPGGILKRLIHGEFEISDYKIQNHFLFIAFTVENTAQKTKTFILFFGLIGGETCTDSEDYNTYWLLTMIKIKEKTKTKFMILPIFIWTTETDQIDLLLIFMLTRFTIGKYIYGFIIYGLLHFNHDKKTRETLVLLFYIYSYSIFRYQKEIIHRNTNKGKTFVTKAKFYLYILCYFEKINSNFLIKNNSKKDEINLLVDEYNAASSRFYMSIFWIWTHYGLINYLFDYTEHRTLMSVFLLFRFEKIENFLSYYAVENRKKLWKFSLFWIATDKIALYRYETCFENKSFEKIISMAFLIHYLKKIEITKDSEIEKSTTISMIPIFLHYKTALIHHSTVSSEKKRNFKFYVFPLIWYEKQKESNSFTKETISSNDNQHIEKSKIDIIDFWILFLFRYSYNHKQSLISILPLIPFKSWLTFWLCFIRYEHNEFKGTTEFRLLYRLILYKLIGDDLTLEINPWLNYEVEY